MRRSDRISKNISKDTSKEEEEDDDEILQRTTSFTKRRKVKHTSSPPQDKYKYSLDKLIADKEAKETNPEDDLNVSQESQGNVSKDDFTEDKITTMIALPELARDTLVEHLFESWPKTLPKIELKISPEQCEGAQNQQKSLIEAICKGPMYQKELLIGGWLMNCYQNGDLPCPEGIIRWLFHLIAYSSDKEMAIAAFRTLETLLTRNECSMSFILGPSYPPRILVRDDELTTNPSEWIPNFLEFIKVFGAYGVDISSYKDENIGAPKQMVDLASQASEEAHPFPVYNFSLVVQYLDLCITNKPSTFTGEQVLVFVQILCRALLDPLTSSAVVVLESALATLFRYFSIEVWRQRIPEVCKLLFSTVTRNHQNWIKIAQNLPLTVEQGSDLQARLSYYILHRMFKQKISDEALLAPLPVTKLTEFVKSIQVSTTTDYSRLYTVTTLIDLCTSDLKHIKLQSENLQVLKSSLQALNNQIREVSGYNLLITKAKDKLIEVVTKLTLLANVKSNVKSQSKIYN